MVYVYIICCELGCRGRDEGDEGGVDGTSLPLEQKKMS